jgi:hypothetical protein
VFVFVVRTQKFLVGIQTLRRPVLRSDFARRARARPGSLNREQLIGITDAVGCTHHHVGRVDSSLNDARLWPIMTTASRSNGSPGTNITTALLKSLGGHDGGVILDFEAQRDPILPHELGTKKSSAM